MAEGQYIEITWTGGDIITEAKLDNMVSNQRAVDAMNNGVQFDERATPSTPTANKLHLYCKDKGGVSTLYAINDGGTDFQISERHSSLVFTYAGDLTVGGTVTPILVVTRTLTIVKAYANVVTAPTGANAVFDIHKNASTIWSTQADRLTILAGVTSGVQTSFNTTTLVEGDVLTLDIDQIGSTVVGADLTVVLRCK